MRRPFILAAVIGAGLLTIGVSAQLPPGAQMPNFGPVGTPEKLADNLYFLPGAGGNTAVLVHAKGVLLVDTKVPKNGQALMDAVKRVTDKPVTHIVNTHTHFDHAGSNPEFPASVEIVTHANTRTNMANTDLFKSEAGKAGLPDRTFKDRMTLLSGKDAVDLYHFGPSHTGGDAYVVFRNARVMHAGDTFPQKGGIFIDRSNGGNAVAHPETLSRAIAGVKNVDRVITGHSTVVTWQDFVDFRDFHRLALTHARASVAAGKAAEQALADFKPPAKFKDYRYGTPGTNPPGGWFATLYQEVKR